MQNINDNQELVGMVKEVNALTKIICNISTRMPAIISQMKVKYSETEIKEANDYLKNSNIATDSQELKKQVEMLNNLFK